MPINLLTARKVDSFKRKDKSYTVADGGGLYLEVPTKGKKRWLLRVQIKKPIKRSLGTYPEVPLQEAREKALKLKRALLNGEDPLKDVKRDVVTWGALAEEWYAMKQQQWSPVHSEDVARSISRYLRPAFGEIPAENITTGQVHKVILPLVQIKNETGHRALSVCKQIFAYGVSAGKINANPCLGLAGALPPRAIHTHRAAVTTPEAVGQLMRDISGYPHSSIVKDALYLSAYTACRPQEIYKAKWEEIDLANQVWVIPSERMKARREHHVPLPRQAIAVLESIKTFLHITGTEGWVFPSMRAASRNISECTVLAALRTMGYEKNEMCAHGFRAMFSTIANRSGRWSSDLIETQLAHVERNSVRAAYNHTDYYEQRVPMMQWYADYLDELAASLPSRTPD